jgi:hypothetical protein
VSRGLRVLVTIAAGIGLGLAALVGIRWSSGTGTDAGGTTPLDLDGYCRHAHGGGATAYRPQGSDTWRCSAWRNGVWGLDPIDLAEACRWQGGTDAVLTTAPPPERGLACTV